MTNNPRTDVIVTSNITVVANFAVLEPPAITNANMVANQTSFTLTGQGAAGQDYILMGATNLPPVWVPLLTNTADGNGVFSFTDLHVTNYPQRFYRVQTQ